jgi:acetylornithine deacetylase/succinyl-diaminopimelate desuccinylase-like protein
MAEFRDRFVKELGQADAVYFPNPYQDERGRGQVHLGTKGLVALELRVHGGEWGGPTERALFAPDTLWVDPPAWHLIWALNSLVDRHGRPVVDGFFDGVRPLTTSERDQLTRLKNDFDDVATMRRLGIRQFRDGRRGADYFEEYASGPVLNIDGYSSGYTGPFIKTMLPDSAVAKIDIRLVPDMDKDEILRKLRSHLDKHGFQNVDIWLQGSYNWSKTDLSASVIQAAIAALQAHGVEPAIWPMTYYCAPTSVFNEPPLNLPVTDAGVGHMGRWHEANEFFAVDSMRAFEKWMVTFLYEFGGRE